DRTILLVFGDLIDVETGRRCSAAAAALRGANLQGISDIVPTFNTVALHYQPSLFGAGVNITRLTVQIENTLSKALGAAQQAGTARQIDIPVCYGGDYGPDLAHVAEHCKLD